MAMHPFPIVGFSTPKDGATVPMTFTLTVAASEPGGSLSHVDILDNGQVLKSFTTPPYTLTSMAATAGAYQLEAVAYDPSGNSRSANVEFIAQPGAPAQVMGCSTDHDCNAPLTCQSSVCSTRPALPVEINQPGVGCVNPPTVDLASVPIADSGVPITGDSGEVAIVDGGADSSNPNNQNNPGAGDGGNPMSGAKGGCSTVPLGLSGPGRASPWASSCSWPTARAAGFASIRLVRHTDAPTARALENQPARGAASPRPSWRWYPRRVLPWELLGETRTPEGTNMTLTRPATST